MRPQFFIFQIYSRSCPLSPILCIPNDACSNNINGGEFLIFKLERDNKSIPPVMYSTTNMMMPTLLKRNAVNARHESLARCASGGFCFRRTDRLRSIWCADGAGAAHRWLFFDPFTIRWAAFASRFRRPNAARRCCCSGRAGVEPRGVRTHLLWLSRSVGDASDKSRYSDSRDVCVVVCWMCSEWWCGWWTRGELCRANGRSWT